VLRKDLSTLESISNSNNVLMLTGLTLQNKSITQRLKGSGTGDLPVQVRATKLAQTILEPILRLRTSGGMATKDKRLSFLMT